MPRYRMQETPTTNCILAANRHIEQPAFMFADSIEFSGTKHTGTRYNSATATATATALAYSGVSLYRSSIYRFQAIPVKFPVHKS